MLLNTPFGNVRLLVDEKPMLYKIEQFSLVSTLFPDIQARFKISFDYDQKKPAKSIKCFIENTSADTWIESGERLEAIAFYNDSTKLTLGVNCSFGDAKRYDFDFDGQYIKDGIECLLSETTVSQLFVFAISWIDPLTENNDVQTWYASDPSIQ